LEFASDELKNNKEIVLASVTNSRYAIYFASDELKKDFDVISTAIGSDEEF